MVTNFPLIRFIGFVGFTKPGVDKTSWVLRVQANILITLATIETILTEFNSKKRRNDKKIRRRTLMIRSRFNWEFRHKQIDEMLPAR